MQVQIRTEEAMGFPMDRIVARYRKENDVSQEVAHMHEREVKRYLAICASHKGQWFPMVASIDALWHTFLIFTKEYQEFCRALGVPFIHHSPLRENADYAEMQATYERFLEIYCNEFGEPPISVWPARIDGNCGCNPECCGTCMGG